MSHKKNSIAFWDHFFEGQEPLIINKKNIKIQTTLDQYLKQIGDHSENVLDIGCGLGTCLIGSACLGKKIKKGVGFDTSKHAIKVANKTIEQSHIKGLSFHVADESFLETLKDNSFDGIICSNFLDVVTKDISDKIINEIKRILKPSGLLLLKLNFLLDEKLIKKLNMEMIEENTYQMNGVIRSYNLTTDAWIQRFSGFKVLKVDGYQRAEGMPEDRVILFSKK